MERAPFRAVLRYVRGMNPPGSTEESSDRALIERFARSRDEAAFAILVRRHGTLVMNACRRELGNDDDAEDAFQATFLVLARKAGRVAWRASIGSWLHDTACRIARKLRCSESRRCARERDAVRSSESSKSTATDWKELCDLLDDELRRLPAPERAALIACYLEGQTQDEAALQLGLSLRTLQRHVARGRERLRARFARRGLPLPAILLARSLVGDTALPIAATDMARSAALFAAGQGSAARASALDLANGALRAMAIRRWQLVAVCLMAAGALAAASGSLLRSDEDDPAPVVFAAGEAPAPVRQHFDADGDAPPGDALAILGTRRLRHTAGVNAVAFSPDGKIAIAGDSDGYLVYWDVASGWRLGRRHLSPIHAIAISTDGKTLTCGSPGRIHILNADSGAPVGEFATGSGPCFMPALGLSRDGKLVAVPIATSKPAQSAIGIFETVSGQKRFAIPFTGELSDFALSPDGRTLAVASFGEPVRTWDITTGKEGPRLADIDGRVIVERDEFRFKGLHGEKIQMWGPPTDAQLISQFSGGMAIAADGKTLIGHTGQRVLYVNATTGEVLKSESAGIGQRLAVSRDGKTVASFRADGAAQTFDLWDATTGHVYSSAGAGHLRAVCSLAFSPDGKTLVSAAGDNDRVQKWDTTTGSEVPIGAINNWSEIIFSPDGSRLTGYGPSWHGVYLFDINDGKVANTLSGSPGAPSCLSFDARGDFILEGVSFYKSARLWDVTKKEITREFTLEQDQPAPVILSPGGGQIAAGGYAGGAVRRWSTRTGWEMTKLATPHRIVHALAYAPDGKTLATADVDGPVYLWDIAARKQLRQFDGLGRESALYLAFTADGKTLLGHRGGQARLWDVATGKELNRFPAHPGTITAAAVSPDGRLAATAAADTTIFLWDLTGAKQQSTEPSRNELELLWNDMSAADDRKGYRAAAALAAAPRQAIPFLAERLQPAAGHVRAVRAVRTLARIHSAEAWRILERTAAGEANSPLAREAKAALQRRELEP
jgi:RNA polymerase sigma factor (sigma-70 family)